MDSRSKALRAWRAASPRIVNLGCGHKTSAHPSVLNVDWSMYLRLRTSRLFGWLPSLLLTGERLRRYQSLPPNVLAYDIRRGLPFESESLDAVYHSHMLEHVSREQVPAFLRAVLRVLRPGGVHRIVVPDLELLTGRYLQHLRLCEVDSTERARHDGPIAEILEQCVREIPAGIAHTRGLRRWAYLKLLGDARDRGECHRWMYDRFNLQALLEAAGYEAVTVTSFARSDIPGWTQYGLDVTASGQQYKEDSLYIEAVKHGRPRG